MTEIKELEERIVKIETRNKSVKRDKSWETSLTRRVCIIVFTYLAIVIYLEFIVHIDPWINAIVPAVGFLLSTLPLPYIKRFWGKHIYKS